MVQYIIDYEIYYGVMANHLEVVTLPQLGFTQVIWQLQICNWYLAIANWHNGMQNCITKGPVQDRSGPYPVRPRSRPVLDQFGVQSSS